MARTWAARGADQRVEEEDAHQGDMGMTIGKSVVQTTAVKGGVGDVTPNRRARSPSPSSMERARNKTWASRRGPKFGRCKYG